MILGFFADLDYLRVLSHAADKIMDIQAAKAAAKSQMLPRRQTLIPEKIT